MAKGVILALKGDGKGSMYGRWSRSLNAKHYSHRLEFLEACSECQRNVSKFYFGGLGEL